MSLLERISDIDLIDRVHSLSCFSDNLLRCNDLVARIDRLVLCELSRSYSIKVNVSLWIVYAMIDLDIVFSVAAGIHSFVLTVTGASSPEQSQQREQAPS